MTTNNAFRGLFKPLRESELERIHTATLWVLENVGVRFTNRYVQEHWRQAG
ncbi:MAG: hypothetical protein EHM56_14305, partial [Chloroflexi bacterium]